MVRTLGPYPRGSRFDPDRRLCLLDAKNEGSFTCSINPNAFARRVLEQVHGPEALTVERPVETRQEEIRALPGPHTEHEPDGDGTALITRHDVVRLHGALRNDEYVNGRPPVSHTGSWRFESSLVDCGRG